MDPIAIRELLQRVSNGNVDVEEALAELKALPFSDLGFAKVDHHRALRTGFPEVILGQSKTTEQIIAISREIDSRGQTVLVTRLSPDQGLALTEAMPEVKYDAVSRTAVLMRSAPEISGRGTIVVATAGTSDLPVAEEAAVTAEVLGNRVERIYDVGVAGVHRLLSYRSTLEAAAVIIVVAGMEGALASVIGGLVSKPIIGVPTSVGYGVAFGGIAALLGMLTSCASGVTVVNIDNVFGAACAAAMINRNSDRTRNPRSAV